MSQPIMENKTNKQKTRAGSIGSIKKKNLTLTKNILKDSNSNTNQANGVVKSNVSTLKLFITYFKFGK